MTDDGGETDDELGQVGEQMNGIANRFGTSQPSDTSDTTETPETSEATNTTETMDTTSTAEATPSGETTDTSSTTDTSEMPETSEASETPAPGDEEFQLREHWNGRTIYLPDDVVDELDLRYKECSIEWQRQRGGELPKNERFYPAVVRAALNETSIEEELGLAEE